MQDMQKIRQENNAKIAVAFDVDGTLIDPDNRPRYEVINLLLAMHWVGVKIVVWSGCGVDYAETMVSKLGLEDMVTVKPKDLNEVSITFDDMEVHLGAVNIMV